MSKIAFTVAVPHEGKHIPQFSISCQNATFISFKGKEIGKVRFGNGNLTPKKGLKRLECGVTTGSAATRFSVLVNTSVVLPNVAWSTPGPASAAAASKGGALPTKEDLKRGAKKIRDKSEGNQPLRIENSRRRDERYRDDSTEDNYRSRRGERQRRGDRRRQEDDDREEPQRRLEDGSSRRHTYPDIFDEDRARSRRRHRDDDRWEDERDDHVYSHVGRHATAASDAGDESRRRVAGKNINPKYRRSSVADSASDNGYSRMDSAYEPVPASRHSRRHHDERDRARRRRGRRDGFNAPDYGYRPSDEPHGAAYDGYDGGGDIGFEGPGGD